MVVFIGCDHEQCVRRRDLIGREPRKEFAERVVVSFELSDIARFTRAVSAASGKMVVVRVGDVAIDDWHATLEHGGEIAQALRRGWVERIGETRVAAGVLGYIAVEILDRTAGRDLRL